jgi:hypothetical protein
MPLDLTERLQAFPPRTLTVTAIWQIATAIRNRTLIKNCSSKIAPVSFSCAKITSSHQRLRAN